MVHVSHVIHIIPRDVGECGYMYVYIRVVLECVCMIEGIEKEKIVRSILLNGQCSSSLKLRKGVNDKCKGSIHMV